MKFDFRGLKIAFLAGTLGQGGAERQLFYILRTLRDCGAEPRLLCLTQGEFWEERIRHLGIPVLWVGKAKSRPVRLLQILLSIKDSYPKILQSQHFYTNLYVILAARMLGLREIGAIRSNVFSELSGRHSWARRWSLRTLRMVAVNSQAALRTAVTFGIPPSRLFLLPNFVDTDSFKPIPYVSEGPVRLLAVGRLVPVKRYDRFLSMVARVVQTTSAAVSARIVGDGPLRPELQKQAASLGLLPGVVSFSGSLGETASIYRENDILVLTSDYEGTPNVVLEAMAAGIPIVATRVGGVPDIVSDEQTGYLVDPADESALPEAILKLVSDRKLRARFGARAREWVEANHSLEKMPVYLEELYRAAIA